MKRRDGKTQNSKKGNVHTRKKRRVRETIRWRDLTWGEGKRDGVGRVQSYGQTRNSINT